MIGKFSLLFLFVGISNCFLFPDTDNWNDLKVTWGINPFGSNNFVSLPRTEQEAVQNGWTKEKGCSDGVNSNRYVLRGDRSVLLLFNANGIIAGIASALPKNLPFNVPSQNIQPYFDDEGDSFVISAYFIDPTSVCVKNRFRQSTGDRLVFYSKQKSLSISLKENSIDTFWTKGKCFWTMGQHYWVIFFF
jgi:charged multivesicular body protein 7